MRLSVIDRELAALHSRKEQLSALSKAIDEQIEALEKLRGVVAKTSLQSSDTVRTISTMRVSTETTDSYVRRGIKRARRNHPAQRKLYKHGVTLSALARDLNLTREQVSSWFAKGTANRPIPHAYAQTLLDKYGIPLSDWARLQ